ncbi:type I DNA topoisomerase [Pseudomonas granadensis]|uniref:DNA topoisomerase 1 n=1 Tax=Pseudomonas granadensis TaxID=1421430 RepID=A0ABX7GBE2_9PSED|nr:type I DNA topoisomerase [Pseudomonas granadensis]MBN6776215.1 type I DNA topoisomerase [Pseudomonas granadensis]MBN6807233.1 type I DNA topoisomerase [Pseudomonas granadensis]MBN6834175.1 type I DNA topoisomerase [Pseudomonas granadensis]MBN6841608.1 type I DNA topoisomerase [Pseudomonas granadensis]MBN6870363.1 type I DNA topoisomerase [Pseudomonas granadensis]
MGKSLVIVESPAKAKTINKYLGNQYVVKSSIGHIRDLPTSGSASASKEPAAKRGKAAAGEAPVLTPKEKARKQLVSRMGVDPEHGWKAQYEILPGKEKVIEELRRLAKDADTIYLATDLDREGEAIAWHLREAIGGDDSRYKRVVFNEITKKAIQEAFSEPGELDIDRVNAQQARRFLDRVVGYMVSPLLWAKIARGLSAGRVQSVAVKLVVEREREIRAFNPEEYWEVHADLGTTKGSTVRFEVAREKGEAFKPLNEAQAMAALEKLKASSYSIVKREDKPTSSKPSAPFITSTLQQAASNRLGFGVKKTMMMAQRLYEAGYITYMRTDSTNLSADAVAMARTYIEEEFGKKYLPESPNVYSSKEGAQEAHEAIRPSDANTIPSKLAGMERDAERLYELIWRQFLACQMLPAQYLSTTVSVGAGDFELRAKGRILKFDGYTRVMPQIAKPGDDDVLPDMAQGDVMKLIKLDPSQHFTKPPARYSEASLVKEMEKRGIGRPSTYAAIISTIQDRGYVTLHNRRFYSEKMGDIVTERLSESFSNLMDYGFTAGMEENLDDVAQGERDWKSVLDEFYGDFKKKLEVAENPDNGMRANQPVMTDIPCTTCGRPMQIRTASTGVFLGCSGYSLPPKERCKATVNLVPGDEIAADDEGESESLVLRGKHRCPICSTAMDAYLLDEKRKLHICGNNPDCAGYEIEEGSYRIKGYEGPSLECDKCGSEMQLKTGRFGKFFGCTNPTCKNTRKLLKSGDAAPPKMDPVKMPELKCEKVNDTYILRDGASGLFLAASQFPKNRETRAPLVIEILPHKDEIDPKYHFLCEAPQKDPDGLPAVIRYSRKTKEQYVQTEVDGKPTGWKAYYDGGKWTVEDKRSAKAKAE